MVGGRAIITDGENFLELLFSCSLRDMAMANWSSSSSSTCFWVDPPPDEVVGVCDSWARELLRYSRGRSLLISAAAVAALSPSL